jgi:hypothetical protein
MKLQLPSIDFLEASSINRIGVQLHQEEDRAQRWFGHLASQKERQVSLRSPTLDGGFVVIHQRLNNSERSPTTTGYVEWQ